MKRLASSLEIVLVLVLVGVALAQDDEPVYEAGERRLGPEVREDRFMHVIRLTR